jgi:hypothetical protein
MADDRQRQQAQPTEPEIQELADGVYFGPAEVGGATERISF